MRNDSCKSSREKISYGSFRRSAVCDGLPLQDRVVRLLYGSAAGRCALKLLVRRPVSVLAGRLMDTRLSALWIEPFVRRNHIDMSLCEKKSFRSYNDFFQRRLICGARAVDCDEKSFVSPCDGRLSVYDIDGDKSFNIKDTEYTIAALLRDGRLADRYAGGRLWLFRLCTTDYHRYIYNVSGEQSDVRRIDGLYHTVNPFANECLPIYKENTREYCLIKTERFGTILFMEVGAMLVGRIENDDRSRHMVGRGDEKGSFAFGGSTIIIMTQKGAVTPRKDIYEKSLRGLETKVVQGERTGYISAPDK